MKLSFGMIFSIIMIIVFLVFAFYGIGKFLNFQKAIKFTQFEENLQSDIDTLWKSSSGDGKEVSYYLPSDVRSICFLDEEFKNLRYNSKKPRSGLILAHLDIDKTLGNSNSLCIENINNRVEFKLEKNYGETVIVSKL